MQKLSHVATSAGTAEDRWKPPSMIEASRTLMKSEPELAELVREVEGLEVRMAEKGFGTRVEVRASEGSGLSEADLERFLDELATPSRQPFGNA
jgi:hypothetical protein